MIITIINLICFSWVLTNIPDMVGLIKNNFNVWNLLEIVGTCLKCLSFWITLIYTRDIFLASIISMLCYLIENHILTLPIKL